MTGRRPPARGSDLHSTRPGCIPAPEASGKLGNAPIYVKPETYPCAGHGVGSKGGITRLGYAMTYWLVQGVGDGDWRCGPYPTREAAQAAQPTRSAAAA